MAKKLWVFFIAFFFLLGCTGQETKAAHQLQPAEAAMSSHIQETEWTVNYEVTGHNVYMESILPSFTMNSKHADGHLLIKVDGKWKQTEHHSIFIVKGLEKGSHELCIQFVKNKNAAILLQKKIRINIA